MLMTCCHHTFADWPQNWLWLEGFNLYWFVSPVTVTMTKLATTIAAPSVNCMFHGYHCNMGVTNRNLNQAYKEVNSYDHSLSSECHSFSFLKEQRWATLKSNNILMPPCHWIIIKFVPSSLNNNWIIEHTCVFLHYFNGMNTANNTWAYRDMELLFKFLVWYLTSENSKQVSHWVEHKKKIPHVLYYITILLIRSCLNSRFKERTRFHLFMALNRVSEVSAVISNTWKIIIIFHVWWYAFSQWRKAL